MRSQIIEIKEVECITIIHNNLTIAKRARSRLFGLIFLFQTIGGICPV